MNKEAENEFKRLEVIFYNVGKSLYKEDWSGEEIETIYSAIHPKEPKSNDKNARTRAEDIKNVISKMIENGEFEIDVCEEKKFQKLNFKREKIDRLFIPNSYLQTKEGRVLECRLRYVGKGSIYDGAKRSKKPRHNIEVVRPIVIKALEDMIKDNKDITYDSLEHYLKSNDIYNVGHDWLNQNMSKEVKQYQEIQIYQPPSVN